MRWVTHTRVQLVVWGQQRSPQILSAQKDVRLSSPMQPCAVPPHCSYTASSFWQPARQEWQQAPSLLPKLKERRPCACGLPASLCS
jgi:hypothetical protein